MRWKEILVGAAITLIVTVIGGLIVYKVTTSQGEQLTYEIDKQVAFEGASNKISIGSAKIANIGGQAAKDVIAVLKIKSAIFQEFRATSSTGSNVSIEIDKDKHTATLSLKSLLPGEIISAAYLLSNEANVEMQLKSDKSIGKANQIYKTDSSNKSKLNKFLEDFVPLLIAIAVAPLALILRYLRRSSSVVSCKNNNGFVLLHTGINNDAREMLCSAVKNGETGSYALSNYALSLAISGNIEDANKYISAAGFLAKGKHEQAVFKFNSSIIHHLAGDDNTAFEKMSEAIKLSKKEIVMYCRNSVHVKDMIASNAKFKELIGDV